MTYPNTGNIYQKWCQLEIVVYSSPFNCIANLQLEDTEIEIKHNAATNYNDTFTKTEIKPTFIYFVIIIINNYGNNEYSIPIET